MGRRWKRVGRVVFHGGALVSLILATLAGTMWIGRHIVSDGWTWVADEKRDRLSVREIWSAGVNGGILMVNESREVGYRPEADPPPWPTSSRFLHRDDGPYWPPLLPTASSRYFRGDDGRKFLPRTNYAAGYGFPALLSVRKRDLFSLGSTAVAAGEWSTPYFAGREWGLVMPLWVPTVVFAVWPACWEFLYRRGLYRKARERWRRDRGLCMACGYDLRGSPGRRCPECGTEGAAEGAAAVAGT